MKKRILHFLILTCTSPILVSGQSNTLKKTENFTAPKATISELKWISGTWKGTAFGGVTEKISSKPAGGAIMGVFRLIVNDKVSFYQIVTIMEENNSLILRLKHFHSNLKGWEDKDVTMDFPLIKIEKNRVYFDGYTYEKISNDEMNIYVILSDGKGKNVEEKFNYKKVNN